MGDLIAVEAGDQVVVDGRLAEGRIEVDESQLTGESDLVPKRPGDQVYSGSYPDVRARPLRGRDGRRGQPGGPHHDRARGRSAAR